MNPKVIPRLRFSFFITSILFVMLSQAPIFPEIKTIFPSVLFILIFLLTLVYSNMIPDWYLLLLGIVSDVMADNLLGTTSFCYLIVKYLILNHRKRFFSFNFVFTIMGFVATTTCVTIFQYISAEYLQSKSVNINDLFLQYIASILIFPLVYYLFISRLNHEAK